MLLLWHITASVISKFTTQLSTNPQMESSLQISKSLQEKWWNQTQLRTHVKLHKWVPRDRSVHAALDHDEDCLMRHVTRILEVCGIYCEGPSLHHCGNAECRVRRGEATFLTCSWVQLYPHPLILHLALRVKSQTLFFFITFIYYYYYYYFCLTFYNLYFDEWHAHQQILSCLNSVGSIKCSRYSL